GLNAQRRARILGRFVDLCHKNMDDLATALSNEHGKTFEDAKGDVQRGLEVIEFCMGAPHLMKGEFSDQSGSGIDTYSMRQALGVCVGIRSEEHTSELQSRFDLVCRPLL